MQNNNFRGFSSNNRYNNQNIGNSGGFQSTFNQFNYQRNQNQNNPLFSNSNNNINILSFNNNQQSNNNNYPIRLNPLSSFQMGSSTNIPLRANSQKKRLYVKLTQEEKGYFTNLFQYVDNQNMGKLKAKEAANFMKKSGLNKDTLKNIYLIASQSSKEFLEKEEFYVALRLIALAQNNMPFNAQAIILNTPIPPLPNFDLKKDRLADDDNLYEMRYDEKVKFKRIFDLNKDGNNDNISARKAIQMWQSSGANDNTIKKIAEVLRPNETKGFLNLREFQVATHLINLSEKYEIPTQLPNSLRKYLGRPEILNNNNMNSNLNINNNKNSNSDLLMKNLMNIDLGNNNNNGQQIAISYPNNIFGNNNYMNNNFNNINNNNNNQNELQKTMKEIEDLNQKNVLLNNQINMARDKLNNVLRELDSLQNEQQNITNQINIMKEKCTNIMSNIGMNNNNIMNNNYNINNNNNNIQNNNNNINNNSNNKNYNIKLNESGIGPNKSIIGFNLPQQQNQNKNEIDKRKEEYEKLSKQKQNLLDLMNKMQFDKLMINNNNQNEENKNNNNKDIIDVPLEKDNSPKNISPLPNIDRNNKFDDKLLESQAFEPEKLQKLAMDDIPSPDAFNFGNEVVNPYEDNDTKKKDDLNFGLSSPIEDKHFNFDRQSNLSLGSEIKKIDEYNQYPNFNDNNTTKKDNKLEINDTNVFNFEYDEDNKKSVRKESKDTDTFNFNTAENQKEGDEWDF